MMSKRCIYTSSSPLTNWDVLNCGERIRQIFSLFRYLFRERFKNVAYLLMNIRIVRI